MSRTICTEHQCLYSASTSLFCVVQTVQNIIACTVHLYHYSNRLYKASVPVENS